MYESRDVLGWRRKIGVIGPSTNTIVQPEMEAMRPPGVTNHYGRIYTPNAKAISNESFMAGTLKISEGVIDAVRSVMTCEPHWLVMGMSAVTFYGGAKGAQEFQKKLEDVAQVGVTTGSLATAAALRALGGIRRVAFVSPYYPVANAEVRRFLEESGFEVKRDACLQCPSWTAIAQVPESVLRAKLRELDGDDVDALVQVGTNMCMARLAGEAERWLGKPVLAINTATYWHGLRGCGIPDRVPGYGRLLAEL
jgi:maleate isomerase